MESVVSGRSPFGDVGGDPRAFERFWAACAPSCRRFLGRAFVSLRSIAPDRFDEILEDAVHMAFARATARWCTYDPDRASVQTWVNRIAHNHFLREWWSHQHWLRRRASLEEGAGMAGVDVVDQVAVQTAVRSTLHRLPPRQAQAVYLHHGHGLSVAEVAGKLETTPAAVESLAKRGRRSFRQAWERVDGRRQEP